MSIARGVYKELQCNSDVYKVVVCCCEGKFMTWP